MNRKIISRSLVFILFLSALLMPMLYENLFNSRMNQDIDQLIVELEQLQMPELQVKAIRNGLYSIKRNISSLFYGLCQIVLPIFAALFAIYEFLRKGEEK